MINKLYEDMYVFDDGHVREFLILGKDKCLLVDTGFPNQNLLKQIREITTLPIHVVLTHGDRDHTGGLSEFESYKVHKADQELIDIEMEHQFIKEGDQIEIGQYHFDVIEIPGHSYGSIAFLDKEKKLLIVGDSVQKDGPIFMFGPHRDLDLYIESLKKLQTYKGQIDTILPSHHDYPIGKEYIDYCLEDAMLLKEGKLTGTPHPTMPCLEYKGKYTLFYYK